MSLADFYRRLSRTALLYGDPVSARIYARQAANSKDPAKALAKFYAEFFNALEAASGEVGEELVKTTADELESEGWTLDRDDSGEWHATPLQKVQKRKGPIQHARRTSALRYAAARAPKGGVTINGKDYRGGQFIPASQVAQASPEVKAKIEASQKEADERSEQKKQERRGRTVNAGELKGRLAGYAERHGVVKTDTHDAKAAYRMLSRHHGDLVLPRLQELADEAEKALGRLNPENPATERAYNRLGKNLAVLHRMIELHEQGYTGKRTPKEPKHDTQPEQQPGAGSAGTGPELGGTDGGSNGGTDGKSPPKEDERIVTRRADITKPGNPELVPESVRHFLKPHQVQGVAKSIEAIDQHGGFLLADGTGVGKTREILALARRYADQGKKVLIVTKHEAIKPDFKKNTFEGSMLHDSKAMGVDLTLTDGNRSGQVNLTTYKYLREVSPMVDGDTIVIFDEAHSLKNSTSIQTKAGREISKKAKGVLYATATPADKPLQIPYLARARIFGFRKWDETYEELGCIKKTIHAPGGKTIEKWEIDPKVGIDEVYRRLAGLYDRMTEDGLMMKREISFQGVNVNVHRVKLPPEVHETMARIEQAMQGDPLAIKAAYEQVQKELSENAKQLEALGEDATEEAKAPFLSKQDSLIETVETLLRYKNESQNKGLTRAKTLMHQRRQIEPYKIPAAVESAKKELAEGRQVVLFVSRVNASKVERPGFAPVESEGTAKSLRKALEQAGIAPSEIVDLHGGAKTKPGDAMNAFQSGKSKVIIATVESGGTGVNLDDTTGDRPRSMILLTPPLSGVDNLQALGRVWRLTTKSLPRVQYISSDADIDRWNSALVASKMKTLGASVSGDVDELEFPDIDLTEDEIADRGGKLQGKEEPQKPYIWGPLIRPKMEPGAAVPAGELVRVSGKTFDHLDRIKGLGRAPGKEFDPQTKTWMMPKSMADKLRHLPGLRFSDTDQPKPATPREPGAKPAPPPEPPKFPEARKQAILQGLRNLASMDEDRARERNNAGFNGTDGGFGHDLAARDSLSDRQAEAAAAMLAKYKRQLGEELHGIITGKTPVQDPEPVTPAPEPVKEIPTGPQFKSESDYVGGTPTARKTEPSPINLPPEPTKAEPKPLNITTKNVTTKNGPRVIASWSYPSEAFWQAKKAGKLPPEVGVNKYKDVWQVTIWGHSDAQTREIARKLQDMGVVKFQRGKRALHYLRLAASALSYGDAHSARIYRRQADNA